MQKCLLIILISIPFHVFSATHNMHYRAIDSLLMVLDEEIAKENVYIQSHQDRISTFKSSYLVKNDPESAVALNSILYEEYRFFKYDSALYYLEQNLYIADKTNNTSLFTDTKLVLCNLYIINGLFWEAERILNFMNPDNLTDSQKRFYYENRMRLYGHMNRFTVDALNESIYFQNFMEAEAQYATVNMDGEENYLEDIQYLIYFYHKRIDDLKSLCEQTIQTTQMGERMYSFACKWRGMAAELEGDPDDQMYYYLLGAISDCRGNIKNNTVIYYLTRHLFTQNDIKRSHKYINYVLINANTSNSFILKSLIADLVYEINKAYETENRQYQKQLVLGLILIFLLFIILLFSLFVLMKEMRRARAAEQKISDTHRTQVELNKKLSDLNVNLAQTNLLKEECIGIIMGVRPYYIDKMEEYRRQVVKYLKQGKVNELHEFCRSENKLSNEMDALYKEFDQMILNILPTFIDEFNQLLMDDARIYPKNGQMTMELRIYALIRLGIKDSANIARHLRCSVNTIYNYRSRMKNKSKVLRKDFEAEVMKIGMAQKIDIDKM